MSEELSFSANFSFSKDNLSLAANSNYTETVTGTNFINSTQSVTSAGTTMAFGANMGVASVGILIIQNADPNHYVDIDFNNDLTFPIRLNPAFTDGGGLGGFFIAYLGTSVTVIKAKASTAATASCNVIVSAVEH